ncbi:MAG TPA: hypothetical protein VFF52_26840 [Isosphaeraceae bacterium]|nr:hypothetical protein [Isosphaeraceae bacterium]
MPLVIITCRDSGATAKRQVFGLSECWRCGSRNVRSRTERLPLIPFYIYKCLGCGTKYEWWSDCGRDRCSRCGSNDLRKPTKMRRPIGWTFLTCHDCRAVTRALPPPKR